MLTNELSRKNLFGKKLFVIILLLLFACGGPDPPRPPRQDQAYAGKVLILQKQMTPYLHTGHDSLGLIANELFTLAADRGDTALMIKSKLARSRYELRTSNYPGAMKTALEALFLTEKTQQTQALPEIYSVIGNAHKENENYPDALNAAEKALEAAYATQDTFKIIGALLEQAMFTHSYSMLTGDDSVATLSLELHLKGLELAESASQYEELQVPFSDNISQYYKIHGDHEQGILYGKRGASLAKKYNRKRSLTYAFNWLGEIYFYQGNREKGIVYLDSALQYARDLHWDFRVSEILFSKSECYQAAGDTQNALNYFQKSIKIRDSLQMLKNLEKVSQLQIQYETGKKDQQIEMLGLMNRQKAREAFIIILVSVLLLFLSGYLTYQYRKTRKRNRLLRQSHQKINEQAEELQILMQELHHRLKNNLQIVSSLLRLQSGYLTDQDALEVMKTGQQRIEAMSLIHQSLYQQNRANRVDMQEYIKGLVESIIQSFGIDRDRFDIRLIVEIKDLDVDLALPLGLIINEWITNSFKHAYADTKDPRLFLCLRETVDIHLEIEDNGKGMSRQSWDTPQNSFGLKLVKVLTRQLRGKCEMDNRAGTRFFLQVPYDEIKKAV